MGTRAGIHFYDQGDAEPQAIIFRHWDGYPEETGRDILEFFAAVEAQAPGDTRFNDSTILASRYVVWLARQFATHTDPDAKGYSPISHADERPLDFLSVRVMREDSADIEYRYHIHCEGDFTADGSTRPRVIVEDVYEGRKAPLEDVVEAGFPHDED
jgi:hypothetical protein